MRALESGAASSAHLTLDLCSADFIDSAILQAMANTAAALREKDGRLRVLVATGSHPEYALKIVGFGEVMDISVEGQ